MKKKSSKPASSPIPPPPAVPPAEALPLSFLVELGDPGLLPAPAVDLFEDEDDVIARLFPSDIPEQEHGAVPAPPTLTFSPEGVLLRRSEEQDAASGPTPRPRNPANDLPPPRKPYGLKRILRKRPGE